MHGGYEKCVHNFEWKRPLGRLRHGCKYNVKMDRNDTGRVTEMYSSDSRCGLVTGSYERSNESSGCTQIG
jgi:hypothetical protein